MSLACQAVINDIWYSWLELHAILAQMRAAKSLKSIPWDDDRTALYRTIFPQMTGCLPQDEGAQLRFDFETELARLEAA